MRKLILITAAIIFFASSSTIVTAQNATAPSPQAAPTQTSFASFGYFVDELKLPVGTRGQIWATPHSIFEGPFHTNGQLHIYLPPDYFDALPQPFFRGPVSSTSPTVVYYKNVGPYDKTGNLDEEKFHMIFQDGITLGVKPIPLPDNPAAPAQNAAFAGQNPDAGKDSPYVFLPHDASNKLLGGIVASGALESLTFEKKYRKPFRILFQDPDGKTTILTILFDKNETLVERPGHSMLRYSGVPNGAIYVKGDIGVRDKSGIAGTVDGRWTLAAEGAIFISGDLEYADTPEGDPPAGRDVLALIGREVFINNKAPDLLYLYATVMSSTLFVLPSPDRDMPRQGELFWWGNYIGKYPAIMGTFEKDTGEAKDGYDLHKHYDARLAQNPPPYFPTFETSAGQAAQAQK